MPVFKNEDNWSCQEKFSLKMQGFSSALDGIRPQRVGVS